MTLLTEIMERPLDPSYATAAQARRDQGRSHRSRPWDTPWVAVAAVVIGLLLTTSALTYARPDTARAEGRMQLIDRIDDRQRAIDETSAQITGLTTDIRRLETGALDDPAEAARAEELAVAAGGTPVAGPGLRITLDDAAALGPVGGGAPRDAGVDDPGRILYRDLQSVTNELWASGAEAISINGHRLTSTSAIRFAGRAILVGFRPLARPYVVDAVIGEDERRAFLGGAGGQYLADLRLFSARADASPQADLHIPASEALTLRYARVPATEEESS